VALNAVYDLVEKDLRLVGATADKDKQQDGVAETISNLQLAGVRVLVLTGDEQETAINIDYSSNLLADDMRTSRTSWTGTGRRRSPGSSSATAGRSKIFKDFKYFLLGPVLPHGHVKY